MESKQLVHSESFGNEARTIILSVKETKNGRNYLTITQRQDLDNEEQDIRSIRVFENEIADFASALTRSVIQYSLQSMKTREAHVAEQKKIYQNAFKKWSPAEEQMLTTSFKNGLTAEELSVTLQRHPAGIKARLKRLGIEVD